MKRLSLVMVLLASLFAVLPLNAEFFSQRYDFAAEKWIRLGTSVGDIELMDVQFELPAYVGPRKLNIKGRDQATVNLKNYGKVRTRVQVAIALFDADGNLVACGTTGTKIAGTKPGGTESFYVNFDYVNTRIGTAKTFYLTVETEPDTPEVSSESKTAKASG